MPHASRIITTKTANTDSRTVTTLLPLTAVSSERTGGWCGRANSAGSNQLAAPAKSAGGSAGMRPIGLTGSFASSKSPESPAGAEPGAAPASGAEDDADPGAGTGGAGMPTVMTDAGMPRPVRAPIAIVVWLIESGPGPVTTSAPAPSAAVRSARLQPPSPSGTSRPAGAATSTTR